MPKFLKKQSVIGIELMESNIYVTVIIYKAILWRVTYHVTYPYSYHSTHITLGCIETIYNIYTYNVISDICVSIHICTNQLLVYKMKYSLHILIQDILYVWSTAKWYAAQILY